MESSKTSIDEEFREFVAARSAALHRAAYLLTGNWASSEDLVQTALAKTYLAWKRLGGIENVEAYTRRVLYTTNASWWRRRSSHEVPTEAIADQVPGIDDMTERTAERDSMWRHVSSLPRRQRAVLVLRYYEDLSEAEIADVLGISPGTVKSQCSRALTSLRRTMGLPSTPTATTERPGIRGRGR